MNTETLSFETPNGNATAFVSKPAENTDKAVIVIQEYWGLNDHIRDIANRYAAEGFIAIAPDLYRGQLATNPGDASKLMQALKLEDGLTTIKSSIDKAAETYGVSHFGITGFCMGGTYALRAACELEGISAAAPFYGDIPEEEVL
jgi:carboxymethylenebutenolidase